MLNKEVLRPVPGLLAQIFAGVSFCLTLFGASITLAWGMVKAAKMYAPVAYNAPRIELAAPIDNCSDGEALTWDPYTQSWFCYEPVEFIDYSAGANNISNIGIYASASGGERSWAFVANGNTQLGAANDDTVTINGHLVVNGVDMTPKHGMARIGALVEEVLDWK